VDRDAVLAAALGAAVLTGCTSPSRPAPTPSPSPSVPPPVDPDVAVLLSWAAAERSLAARYATAVHAVPALKPLRANHLARVAAAADHLRVRGVVPPPPPARAPLRGTPASLVRALADAERRLAAGYLADLTGVQNPKVAVLGAELLAGARQHATVLALVPLPKATR
jgi:hypothetical protein